METPYFYHYLPRVYVPHSPMLWEKNMKKSYKCDQSINKAPLPHHRPCWNTPVSTAGHADPQEG